VITFSLRGAEELFVYKEDSGGRHCSVEDSKYSKRHKKHFYLHSRVPKLCTWQNQMHKT
jgi:hypothetical protein